MPMEDLPHVLIMEIRSCHTSLGSDGVFCHSLKSSISNRGQIPLTMTLYLSKCKFFVRSSTDQKMKPILRFRLDAKLFWTKKSPDSGRILLLLIARLGSVVVVLDQLPVFGYGKWYFLEQPKQNAFIALTSKYIFWPGHEQPQPLDMAVFVWRFCVTIKFLVHLIIVTLGFGRMRQWESKVETQLQGEFMLLSEWYYGYF